MTWGMKGTNLDPDQVTRLVNFEKLLSVFQVGLGVGVEFGFVGLDLGCDVLPEEVVEERPERCLRVRGGRGDQQEASEVKKVFDDISAQAKDNPRRGTVDSLVLQ